MKDNAESMADILEPFERLIDVEICGAKVQVPENNPILRCLQYLDIEKISNADLCWNGDCLNCQVWVKAGNKEKALIACRAKIEDGMKIVRMSPEIS
ncbi:MAG: 2Fe-2S iron-sulfur cluster-binding protein [Pyrinomonadaceae bacterium]|nr:2Fe-2S iron-sulfur cluster-binding protein [Pyrinomonadaceae bacterium]